MIPFKIDGNEFFDNIINLKKHTSKAYFERYQIKHGREYSYRAFQKSAYEVLCIVPISNKHLLRRTAFDDNYIEYTRGVIARTKFFV